MSNKRSKIEVVDKFSFKLEKFSILPQNSKRIDEGGLRTKGYFKDAFNNSNTPLVTIITISYNNKELLEQTLLSVIVQNYKNIEYIVIDGASTDGTLDILHKYDSQIDYWVSEPDNGIADAMNKGIFLSTGILINHLHSGDKFSSDKTVTKIVESYVSEKWKWCFGNQVLKNSSDEIIGYFCPPKFNKNFFYLVNTIPHQTVFAEESLFRETGVFDEQFTCAMDYHLWLRFVQVAKPKQFNFPIADFLLGGRSSDIKLALKEEVNARENVLNLTLPCKIITLGVAFLRYLKNKLRITTFVDKNTI
jgi:glycosyltransferase involved in cell wall biosynthesis